VDRSTQRRNEYVKLLVGHRSTYDAGIWNHNDARIRHASKRASRSKTTCLRTPAGDLSARSRWLQFLDRPFALVLPSVVALLTIFNFWFTLNRVQSANRIVAYIQLVLEPSAKLQWISWESSLRKYRRWLKANPDARIFIDDQFDRTAVPDALMYYPAVYYFHLALMSSATLASVGLLIQRPNWWRFVFFLSTLLVVCRSVKDFTRWTPERLRASIERNRVIWQNVLGEDRLNSWRQTVKVTSTTPLKQLVGFFTKLGTRDQKNDSPPEAK
jgi:hypothetical protein